MVWETSRAGRDAEDWFRYWPNAAGTDIRIYVTSEDELYDLSKPHHWKRLATDGVNNAFSSEETSLRVKRDADAQAELGRPHDQVLYGYERVTTRKPKN